MKTKNVSFLMMVVLLMAITSAGAQKNEDRNVGSFTKISLSIDGDVYISQGTTPRLTIEAEPDILDDIITEVKNGELKIRFKTNWVRSKEPVTIWITTADLEGLYLAGSGNMITETPIKAGEMELELSGSGDINIKELSATKVDCAISGSGSINAGGKTDELEVAISGSGDCDVQELNAREAEVQISGSGNCNVNVSDVLNVAIAGSGTVYYTGKPLIEAAVSGSGKVKPL